MVRVTSFHSSAADGQQLNAITREFLALERARIYRRLLVARFGLLALVASVIGVGFHVMSLFESWFTVGLCMAAPLCAWVAELRCVRRLSQHLAQLPESPQLQAVRKS